MNLQLACIFPIPIVVQIILYSDEFMRFRIGRTCKLFLAKVRKIHSTIFSPFLGETKLHVSAHFGAIDSKRNIIYFSSRACVNAIYLNHTPPKFQEITTPYSRLKSPRGLALDEENEILYVCDFGLGAIFEINLRTSYMQILQGNDDKSDSPYNLVFDREARKLYVLYTYRHYIREIFLDEGRDQILCGNLSSVGGFRDGNCEDALLYSPNSMALDSLTRELYVSDYNNHVIRSISLKERTIKTIYGLAQIIDRNKGLSYPQAISFDPISKYLYFSEDWAWRNLSKLVLEGPKGPTLERLNIVPTNEGLLSINHTIIDPTSKALYMLHMGGIHKIIDWSRICKIEDSPIVSLKRRKLVL